ncbi:beta-galactosidase [Plantactinospora sp. KLBMP9567]|uniref:beta-galactosidase n=1 Tax=Plantactinospora sp. KLBMP9567 TaxID=3085900 RepID=UPI00298241A7|nr:beta-galactosidase [Plantactinospora sp. KLBMP9567]MDW5324819.1 beta-galactosidase [Plantactinospora sp. KLBMP9567]
MSQAQVGLVTVGVFAWAMLEPAPGRYDLDWLDRLLGLLARHGIAADLATAAPPPWFSHTHRSRCRSARTATAPSVGCGPNRPPRRPRRCCC